MDNSGDTTKELELAQARLELVEEAYADAIRSMMAMEDIGWTSLTGLATEERYTIKNLQDISEKLQEWADTNPLLWRGNEIRCSYLFGNDYKIGTKGADSKISARANADIENPVNQAAIFSPEALSANEKSRYTDGQVFACFNKATRRFQVVPFRQITDAVTNPDDPGEVWFYLRSQNKRVYNQTSGIFEMTPESVWIPVDTYEPDVSVRKLTRIAKHPIDWTKVIVDSRVNRKTGDTWGLPDAFAAAPWALAYSSYMRDGTKVMSALAEWVWLVKPKSRKGNVNAGVAIKDSTGPAKTIVSDMDVSSLPTKNAVDLNTGRPLAAQVASALGISVVILLSDPGQSGAYGTAQTLTDPTIRTMQNRRRLNTQFLERCLRLLGIKDPAILWEKMAQDPDHREMQTRIAAMQTGAFHEDEFREPIAELAGFTLRHDFPPEGFMLPNNSNTIVADTANPMSKATGQGGASTDNTAKPSAGDNSLRDMDADSDGI